MGTTIYSKDRFAWAGGAGSARDPAMWQDLTAPALTGTTAPDPNGGASTEFGIGGEVTDGLTVDTLTVGGQVVFDQGVNAKTASVSGELTLQHGGNLGKATNDGGTIVVIADIAFGESLTNSGTIVTSGAVGFGNVINSGSITGSGVFNATTLDNSGAINAGSVTVQTLVTAGEITTSAKLDLQHTSGTVAVTVAGGLLNVGTGAAVEVLAGSDATDGIGAQGPVVLDAGARANGLTASQNALIASGATITDHLFTSGSAVFAGTGTLMYASVSKGELLVQSGGSITFGTIDPFKYFDVGGLSRDATLNVKGGQIEAIGQLDLGNGATINVDGAGSRLTGGEFDLGTLNNIGTVSLPYATFNVSNGGQVNSGTVYIGYENGNTAVDVNGGTWIASNIIMHAPSARASLQIAGGGTMMGKGLFLLPASSKLGTGSGTVTVDGAGSLFRLSDQLALTPSTGSPAVVVIQNNGSVASNGGRIQADTSADATVKVLNGGTWTSSASVTESGTLITDGEIRIAQQQTGIALAAAAIGSLIEMPAMTFTGTAAVLEANTITVGVAKPLATNDQSQPNGTGGIWSYSGTDGRLTVSSNASLQASPTLTLAGVPVVSGGTVSFKGGIVIASGGQVELGGSGGTEANGLKINPSGLLVGHGLIDSDVVGHAADTGAPLYALKLDNQGTIEAKDGLLVVHGSVAGGAASLIDENAVLELDGGFGSEADPGGTIDFQSLPAGTLVIGDPDNFHGSIGDLAEDAFDQDAAIAAAAVHPDIASAPTIGSSLVFKYADPAADKGVFAATIGKLQDQLDLQIGKGKDITDYVVPPAIPLFGTNDAAITHNFFRVTQSGTDTVLTYTKGNPIDLAVSGPSARKAYSVDGRGVRVGIISGNFGSYAADQAIDALPSNVRVLKDAAGDFEGRAMAQIVHAIAPQASIYFYSASTNLSFLGLSGQVNTDQSLADAIRHLQEAGCDIIVDDVSITGASLGLVPLSSPEANHGSLTQHAIRDAAQLGVTYITSAGNGPPIYGHALDPFAITVGAMNWLATPTSVGGYLPSRAEPFSSIAGPGRRAPNITGPDSGPTTLPLAANLKALSPFIGTSAAAPAVAGVAALMVQASRHQLDGAAIDKALRATAIATGIPVNQGGAGLVNAKGAVAAALTARNSFGPGHGPAAALAVGDSAVPTVSEAALSQAVGNAPSGSVIRVFLTMSTPVSVTGGVPSLRLNDKGEAIYDPDASDPASGNLVFAYTVGSADATADLAITAYEGNGSTVQDGSSTPADFSAVFDVPTGLSINSPLAVTSVSASQSGEVQAGQTIALALAFNAPVIVDAAGGAPTMTLSNGATAVYDAGLSSPAGGTLTFDYAVGTQEAAPDLSLFTVHLPEGTTVWDASGNNANFSTGEDKSFGIQVGPAFVNQLAVSQGGAIAAGQTLALALTMSGPVSIDTWAGAPIVTLNDGGTANYDGATSDPAAGRLVFLYTVQPGEQAPELQIVGVDLNGASVLDAYGIPVDFSLAANAATGVSVGSPVVVSDVASSQSGTLTTGQSAHLTLTLNLPVQPDAFAAQSGPPALLLNDKGAAIYDAAASTPTSLVFDYIAQSGEATSDLVIVQADPTGKPFVDANGYRVDFSNAVNVALGLQVVSVPRALSWVGTSGGDFANSANWNDLTSPASPATAVPGIEDTAVFSGAGDIFANGNSVAAVTFAGGPWIVDGMLSSAGTIAVGADQPGSLTIHGGSTITGKAGAMVAAQAGADGSRVDVSGEESAWRLAGTLDLGGAGTGFLAVSAGGTVTASHAQAGDAADSAGIVSVIGKGSALTVDDALVLGQAGHAELAILMGGVVSAHDADIGVAAGSTGNVDLEGAGSHLQVTGTLNIGLAGAGVLTLGNNTELTVGNVLSVGARGVVNQFGGLIDPLVLNNTGRVGGNGQMIASVSIVNDGTLFAVHGRETPTAPVITGTGLLEVGSSGNLELDVGSVVATQTVRFTDASGVLTIGTLGGFAATIDNWFNGDLISLPGTVIAASSFDADTHVLTLFDPASTVAGTLQFGPSVTGSVTLNVGGVVPCFVAGTRISTERGDVPVELLRIGDAVLIAGGGCTAPIVWLGSRTVDCERHPEPHKVWPVRISAHALGPCRPSRDLWLSPDHALYVADVLIPVKHLINQTTIVQVPVPEVTYHHIELPRHAVLLAENLPAESYLDAGDRGNFVDGGGAIALYPDFSSRRWDADACAPLIVTGPELDAARRWIDAQALASARARPDKAVTVRYAGSP